MSKFQAMKMRVESPEHSEQIQEKLFEMGYRWADGCKRVQHTHNVGLCTRSNGNIYRFVCESSFNIDGRPEFTLETTAALVEKPKVETVELNGKTYLKSDLELALNKLTPVKE